MTKGTKSATAYGIIAVRRWGSSWETFIVQHQKGHWSFPKGHAEKGETPQEAAAREMAEETGGRVTRFLDIPELVETYSFHEEKKHIEKTVVYFFAKVVGAGTKLQEEEIIKGEWISFEEAEKLITFPEAKRVCIEALSQLKMLG